MQDGAVTPYALHNGASGHGAPMTRSAVQVLLFGKAHESKRLPPA